MTMTNDKMALLELIEKSADTDLVREMLGFAAERLMEAEVQARTGAAHGVRDPARQVQRNGYRERAWETRAGRIELELPRLRRGSYFPSFLEPRRTAEKALTAVIQEALCGRPKDARPFSAISHERHRCPELGVVPVDAEAAVGMWPAGATIKGRAQAGHIPTAGREAATVDLRPWCEVRDRVSLWFYLRAG
jgi:hypothetical protein